MAMTLQQLRDASDEDLIKAHDDIAHALNPSVSYYLDELGRRDTERAIRADQKLAKYILYLDIPQNRGGMHYEPPVPSG